MFLLTFNFGEMEELPDFPEVTLWESFDEAMLAVIQVASSIKIDISMSEAIVETKGEALFIEGFCDIIPITVSNRERVTWMGRPFRFDKWKEEK